MLDNMPDTISTSSEQTTPLFDLRKAVKSSVNRYLEENQVEVSKDLYAVVLQEMEIPLLEQVLSYCNGFEIRAARVLGLARGTLRKKLQAYGLNPREFKHRAKNAGTKTNNTVIY